MITSATLLAVAVGLALVYMALGLAAVSHVPPDKKGLLSGRWPVFFFWWPLYSDMYRESARPLRVAGVLLFALMVATYVWWWRVQRAGG
jgi:hypothetical protein